MLYLLYLPLLGLLTLLYFRLAKRFNIIDKPNHRSSHKQTTIRGGGIVFPIALILQALVSDFQFPFFISGLLLISLVSFYDDLRPLSNKIRFLIHLFAVSLLFLEVGLTEYPLWLVIPAYILVIGTINAYNFMDGINGITGAYSIVILISLYYINGNQVSFISSEWLLVTISALLVFNFFNFRPKARCFAGDVGSVSMAFIIIFYLLLLIIKTEDGKYAGLLLLYGLDSISTIIFRIFRRENIFEAHRSHFYQYLANSLYWPHLLVSGIYALIQLTINVILIQSNFNSGLFLAFCAVSGFFFIILRFAVEGQKRLLYTNSETV